MSTIASALPKATLLKLATATGRTRVPARWLRPNEAHDLRQQVRDQWQDHFTFAEAAALDTIINKRKRR